MKKTLIAIAAAAATLATVSAPAIATAAPLRAPIPHTQARVVVVADHRGPDFGMSASLNSRIANLDARIDQGRRTGGISMREGARLNRELSAIVSTKRSYERSGRGLSRAEAAALDSRLDRLSASIRYERHDRDNRRW